MDPWIHGSAARATAGAVAGTAGSAAAACIYHVIIGGALRAPLYVHDKIHTAAAEAAAPAAAPAAALAAAPAADPWIHGSISFIMKHIFNNEMKSRGSLVELLKKEHLQFEPTDFTTEGVRKGSPCAVRGARNKGGWPNQLWHKLWLHFFWPTFWLHCILYFTYRGGFAPHIGTAQNTM